MTIAPLALYIHVSAKTENPEVAVRAPSAIPRAAEGPPGVRRRGPRRRMRMRGGDDESDEEEEKESDGEEDLDVVLQAEGKIGAKKMRKLQEKAEKRAMREQMEQEREERKKREKEADERRKKEEELQKQEEAARAEEERKRKEEQERREHEEYLKLKEAFTVDEEGQQDMEADLDSHSLLQEFMTYIRETKVVILEDLAAHFKLNTQDVIQRVQDLQTSGDLTGVIDDRGKFIYITMEELEAVAKFIRQNGRVSIAELAESSNRLITLDPDLRRLQSASGTLSPDTLVA
ncbi:hypothetical protein C0Q70_08620 [Pomacea canaliculata]|uniref:DDRGK domain-containing protein 1 n=1 Tax=Pomacea canaliculata TaxID=400727 RepID=A0A2T7P7I6_POMCA|nr:hypothetical protein C0Q70_08620 [Pomacea canaliculata]